MTKWVTVIILIAYISLTIWFCLAAKDAFASSKDSSTPSKFYENFFDLAKIGFTTIGSAFTLILGYYFGQRIEEQKREAQVKQAEAQAQSAKERLLAEEAASALSKKELLAKVSASAVESQPDDLKAIPPEIRPQGRPKK